MNEIFDKNTYKSSTYETRYNAFIQNHRALYYYLCAEFYFFYCEFYENSFEINEMKRKTPRN